MTCKSIAYGALALFLSFSFGCASNTDKQTSNDSTAVSSHTGTGAPATASAHADISSTKADTVGNGTADFMQNTDGIVQMNLKLDFAAMANQSVAVHFHEHGDCGNAGTEAHGHWNPTKEPHGKWDAATHHSGDIGNVQLDAEGKGEVSISSDRWTLGGDEKTNIVNRSIIVHSGVDDYTSQPSGNSGSRIGCGVIMAKQ